MAVSRHQLVLGLVALFCLVILAAPGMAAPEKSGCLSCHQPHRGGGESCVFCHAGNPGTLRKDIGHYRLIAARFASFRDLQHPVVQRGEARVKALGCRRCHRIGGEGTRLATDLDLLPERTTADNLEESIKTPALFMPDFRLTARDRAAVVTYLLAARLKVEPSAAPPKTVHFVTQESSTRIFDQQCGACHRLLSARWGALGRRNIGPNLSALFSRFYPTPPKKDQKWSQETLERWLKNPREFRPTAGMPPLKLKKKELQELFQEMAWEQ